MGNVEAATHPFAAPMRGLNLVEASAGTGKTFTIAGLYLRLVLEAQIPVENILVVTYTKAATAELRDRLRARLVHAGCVLNGTAQADEQLTAIMLAVPDKKALQRRLELALASFDLAAIYTIHGFCQRVLADSAFEAGLASGVELLTELDELIEGIVADFWRNRLYTAPPVVVWHWVVAEKLSPATLAQWVARYAGRADLQVRAGISLAPLQWESTLAEYEAAYTRARQSWLQTRSQVEEVLLRAEVFNRSKLRVNTMQRVLIDIEALFKASNPPVTLLFDDAERLTGAALEHALKNGRTLPSCPFLTEWDNLVSVVQRLRVHLNTMTATLNCELLEFARQQLVERKRTARKQSYDDLINVLYTALHGSSGTGLVDKIQRQYRAALIDEFQDTDHVQYQIFARSFAAVDTPVYFVGDPKQAIYGFRGADVMAYISAAQACPNRFNLDLNWRSDAVLVDGINALFAGSAPFFLDGIGYPVVKAARVTSELVVDGNDERPLRVWFLDGELDETPRNKDQAQRRVAVATANEIVRLLECGRLGDASVARKKLDGGDIAVLVRTHHQGIIIHEALRAAGVAAVRYGHDNVYHTPEAAELERVLLALAEPTNEGWVRSALSTCFFGLDGTALSALNDDEQAWERWLETFQHYHSVWRGHGFVAMLREVLAQAEVASRILGLPEGERRLTNIYHLIELLQCELHVHHGGPAALVKWLAGRREMSTGGTDETVLRLESDARVVKIVTVHAAKGLEYPIVFCPFVWEGLPERRREEAGVVYHDRDADGATVLDFGEPSASARLWVQEEAFAEMLRLFYVAVTRAKHRCYVVHGMMKTTATSPLAWLLYHDRIDRSREPIAALKTFAAQRDRSASWGDLNDLVARAPHAISLERIDSQTAAKILIDSPLAFDWRNARTFRGKIDSNWRVASFSSIAVVVDDEGRDRDITRVVSEAQPEQAELNIFNFPRGTRAGTCLHRVFETWNFTCDDREQLREHCRTVLETERFPERWAGPVGDMVEWVLSTPLAENDSVRLMEVSHDQRVDEMEFYFPLENFSVANVMGLLNQFSFWASAQLPIVNEGFSIERIRGYLHGFIDLVFQNAGRYYIVDYKSNWLGAEYEAYGSEAIASAMTEHDYYLQYLIYTVAVHRYLSQRVPDYNYERHFGGVRYLFIRGMHPRYGTSRGVYAYRPPLALVEALERYLTGWSVLDA